MSVAFPDPGRARTVSDLVEALRELKVWAGQPSYDTIKNRINEDWRRSGRPAHERAHRATVADCFRSGRRRLNTDLVLAVVRALHADVGYLTQWRQALRVVGREAGAAAQVRVQDTLPVEAGEFTGRTGELGRLHRALRSGGGSPVVFGITGTPGVGKTRLAVHAGHLALRDALCDRVLFVDLRGFHPDPAQPAADPSAVLDGFLRLLGVPGQRIPHDLPGRMAAYRARLAGTRTLVILDNAAGNAQLRPLLPGTPGCPAVVTSRRTLTAIGPATRLTLDVFGEPEAVSFLDRAAPGAPRGPDPDATGRIARRCGYLPLALGLVAGHIRATPGWTLTDHAGRLDERHRHRNLDTALTTTIGVSFQHLPKERQRLLRLAALHPGPDFDARSAAALAGMDLAAARIHLRGLRGDHLLQEPVAGRYTMHDLIRAYAQEQSADTDPPLRRRAALSRLFDYYLQGAAAAMDGLAPAEAHRRPAVSPRGPLTPDLSDLDVARAWLDGERTTLVAVVSYTAGNGWPRHATRLSATLFRYLNGGNPADALCINGHARDAARMVADPAAEADACSHLGVAHLRLGRYGPAAEHLRQALDLYRAVGDVTGQACAVDNLGVIEERLGRPRPAAVHFEQALQLFRQAGDPTCEARTLVNLGGIERRLGLHDTATGHLHRALGLFRGCGDRTGEAYALSVLGEIDTGAGRHDDAAGHLGQALRLCRELGNVIGEAWTLDGLGSLHLKLGRLDRAAERHRQALAAFRDTGQRDGEACALNGLGEAALLADRPADAAGHYVAALAVATETEVRLQQARAHAGLGRAYRGLDRTADARRHARAAGRLYAEWEAPEVALLSTF